MIQFLADQNFSGVVVRTLRRKRPDINLITIQEAGMEAYPDPAVLEYAASEGRLTLSHILISS